MSASVRSARLARPAGVVGQLRQFLRYPPTAISLALLATVIAIAVFATDVAPHDPFAIGLATPRSMPTGANPLGVDSIGRDVLSRLIFGARASLLVGFGAVAIQAVLGIAAGVTAGYFRGPVDAVLMRVADVILSFPLFVVVVAAVAIVGPSITNVILVVGLLGWPRMARIVRSQVLSLRNELFIEALGALGAGHRRILFNHILPNLIPTVLITATFEVARAILLEASLSFLGMGVQPPVPSWGNILAEAQSLLVLQRMPWLWVPAGFALMAVILSVNFVGDGLRNALDPRQRS
ncbi:MAG: ABC transporter permease [Trueperaceae bacterium]|nr:ABC transporter permease [Trueperaceae bacterium]